MGPAPRSSLRQVRRRKEAWVWVAYEPTLKAFLWFRISYNQSILNAYLFRREVRARYGKKPVWTDKALFYAEACRLLRLEHRVCPFERKNLIERMNQMLKDRLENFDDAFPCFREQCAHEHVHNNPCSMPVEWPQRD